MIIRRKGKGFMIKEEIFSLGNFNASDVLYYKIETSAHNNFNFT